MVLNYLDRHFGDGAHTIAPVELPIGLHTCGALLAHEICETGRRSGERMALELDRYEDYDLPFKVTGLFYPYESQTWVDTTNGISFLQHLVKGTRFLVGCDSRDSMWAAKVSKLISAGWRVTPPVDSEEGKDR